MKKLTALLLLVPMFAFADPGAATRYLMNEPASLMDIGMVRLNMALLNMKPKLMRSIDGDPKSSSLFAHYDYSADEILVSFSVHIEDDVPATECGQAIEIMRFALTVSIYFDHFGYGTQNRPADIGNAISSRVQLTCKITNFHTGEIMAETEKGLNRRNYE